MDAMAATYEEVARRTHTVNEGGNIRHFTVIESKQTFHEGQYAGKEYRITETFVSTQAGYKGQLLKSSSAPF